MKYLKKQVSSFYFAILENFFCDVISQKQFHEFLYIYKGKIQLKPAYLDDDSTAAQVISWMSKHKIKDLKPDVLQELALWSNESVVHFINLESR